MRLANTHLRFRPTLFVLLGMTAIVSGLGISSDSVADEKTTSTSTKKVLLIAGPPSHGYGAHEHYAGLKVLEESLLEATDDIEVEVVRGWPEDSAKIESADAIVIYCDGGKRHIAMPHREAVRKLLKRGGGLVALHYAVEMIPGDSGDDWTELLGGHFEIDYSVNPHWVAEFKSLPEHPTTTGVQPFRADDEWYFYMRFSKTGKITPILQAVAPEETMRRPDGHHSGNPTVRKSVAAGEPQTVAWAYEPEFGGRSFGFTGGHHHWNWAHEPVRRLVTNAIRWAAGDEIEAAPKPMSKLTAEDLLKDQDYPQPKKFNVKEIADKFEITLTKAKAKAPKKKAEVSLKDQASGDQRQPERAIAGLEIAEGLEATLMGSEPDLKSLTNLDIDHRGRVWVCDVMNYRRRDGARPEGDRILILEDTTGDGKLDKVKTFYQGRDIDSAMGICVLGNQVIVSASPTIWKFTDVDGDDKPDSKVAMFTETGQPQHDHSAHSFLFGPDGKLYWNFGNTGQQVKDADGETIVDIRGRAVVDNGQPLYGGMPFRCDLDGSNFEVLAHNFRNNWETTVDSFGSLWQSDNDDDGNRGTRINFVMEQGNYGYRDELTGAGWRDDRITMEDEIPLQHWHLNDPGVVPNMLQTGAGSPCGICMYEGRLLPERFWDQIIHCDPGPNVVRAYPAKAEGAGYSATIEPLMTGTIDKWFRPADVCVAPDGSLFVTDWYDPGVGGHRQEDSDRGRLFRIAPPGVKYTAVNFDFDSIAGCVDALRNPNLSARYMAWTRLHSMGHDPAKVGDVRKELEKLYADSNPRLRARAMWLLGQIAEDRTSFVQRVLADPETDLRIAAIRLAKLMGLGVAETCGVAADDNSAAVRRELALAIRYDVTEAMPRVWAKLAMQHDGQDRWYLEALGIGSDVRPEECFAAWMKANDGRWDTEGGRDIVWRTRAEAAAEMIVELIADPSMPLNETNRYFRALEYHTDKVRERVLGQLLSVLAARSKTLVIHEATKQSDAGDKVSKKSQRSQAEQDAIIVRAVMRMPGKVDLSKYPGTEDAIARHIERRFGQSDYLQLVESFEPEGAKESVYKVMIAKGNDSLSLSAAKYLLKGAGAPSRFTEYLTKQPVRDARRIAGLLGSIGNPRSIDILGSTLTNAEVGFDVRAATVRGLAKSNLGINSLLKHAEAKTLPGDLRLLAGGLLAVSPDPKVVAKASEHLPLPASADSVALAPLDQLASMHGDIARGIELFRGKATCSKCHKVEGHGNEVGPDLTEIGSKLSREAMITSILDPSAGISHNYENYIVLLDSGQIINGIMVSQDDEKLIVRNAEAIDVQIDPDEVIEMKKSDVSIMPANLHQLTDQQGLIDMIEYLMTLKKKGV